MNLTPDASRPAVLALIAGGVGDRLLALPTLMALGQSFPERVTLITDGFTHQNIIGSMNLRRTVGIEFGYRHGNVRCDWDAIARAMCDTDYLICINTWYSEQLGELVN